ncbi:MAG: uroporphyrinogen-III synthase [Thermoleophilia bacterium]
MTGRDDEARPLRGRVVVVTRPREQAQSLVASLESLGAEVLLAPTIEIVATPLNEELGAVLRHLGTYDLVIFSSANAVRQFSHRVGEWLGAAAEPARVDANQSGQDQSAQDRPAENHSAPQIAATLSGALVAAVGPRTAEVLAERGLPCDIVPAEYVAESLVAALDEAELDLDGAHVLIPRAREARDVLPDELRRRGARVDVVTVYETRSSAQLAVPAAQLAEADFITFTSASTVHQFVTLMGAAISSVRAQLVSLGPQTSAALVAHGLTVAAEADPYTGEGLVRAIVSLVSVQ